MSQKLTHYDDLVRAILKICPLAEFQEDTDGEIIVLTGLKDTGEKLVELDGNVINFYDHTDG